MTLSLRNRLIRISLLLCLLFTVFYIFSFFYLSPGRSFSITALEEKLTGMDNFSTDISYDSLYWSVLTSIGVFFFSMSASMLLYHYFKKKISPEIFFFILFVISLTFQSVRMFQLQLILMETPPVYGVIITRMFYFFRLFGVSCFFAASLFPIGVQFQKFGTILISILLLSFTVAALIPVDLTLMNRNLLYELSDGSTFQIMTMSIRVLTIVNFIRAAVTSESKNYFIVLIAALMIVTGDALLLVLSSPLLPFGLIIGGTVMYGRSLYRYYLWI